MKVYVIYENGDDEELDVLEQPSASRAIESAKKYLAERTPWETRKIKSFEVEEDFL